MSGFIAVTSLGASWKPCQWTGIGCWSSSLAMWWKPMWTHTTGLASVSPLTYSSTLSGAFGPQSRVLLLANCSQARFWVK